jgi:hypothetical protein
VARVRIAAEAAGVVSLAREGRELVVRFGPDWSRAATARAMAPASMDDRLPGVAAGGITYGSNQLRVRLPPDAAAAWRTTQAVIERVSRAA